MNWQDVMIKNFGVNWMKDTYSLKEISKLAEEIVILSRSLDKALDAVSWDSDYFNGSEDE